MPEYTIEQAINIFIKNYGYHVRLNEFAEAEQQVLNLLKIQPNEPSHFYRLAYIYLKWNKPQQGVEWALKALEKDASDIPTWDILAHLYGDLHDDEKAAYYGRYALDLREQHLHGEHPKKPELPQIITKEGKNIIAFSLYGTAARYLEPAVINAQIVNHIYPGWVCRFYLDHSVPHHAIERLKANGAELVYIEEIDEALQHWPGTMWRFLAIDDPSVARVIFRDADSVIGYREAAAVQEWIKSGKLFHHMRDTGSHTDLILAGMWGAIGGAIPHIQEKINTFLAQGYKIKHFADQEFLGKYVWPYMYQSLYAHDRLFGFASGRPFPPLPFNPKQQIGSYESSSKLHVATNYPDGTKVRWTLFSQLEPLIQVDFSPIFSSKEWRVCSYEAITKNGEFSDFIPKRFGSEDYRQWIRIEIEKIE
ncbi:hypothetical protein F9B74_10000 [Pelistega sp. NLN82]|uniref:Uncharacterized protein n=1 Tax=Pelistega ratti TaxID=2652177 RepID=A0A6L9Y8X4_9BURK|nr:hypothetical protein [Pelistega ratti]NEN76635.1 hypothetical protein [Pelistega ratti]